MVEIKDNQIVTDVFYKPTDTHQYLDRTSCHPKDVKWAIPDGQALRLKRICSNDDVFENRLREMRGHFVKGYWQ